MQNQTNPQAPIAIYQTADGSISTEVRLEGETVWLTQAQMVELFRYEIVSDFKAYCAMFLPRANLSRKQLCKNCILRQEDKPIERDIEHTTLM
jgi:hypothetical protein